MSAALTPWFPADVKPVRAGVYQILPNEIGSPRYSYWNGEKWSYFTGSLDRLTNEMMRRAIHLANKSWRGLASDPSVTP